jgi:hypothetical protein
MVFVRESRILRRTEGRPPASHDVTSGCPADCLTVVSLAKVDANEPLRPPRLDLCRGGVLVPGNRLGRRARTKHEREDAEPPRCAYEGRVVSASNHSRPGMVRLPATKVGQTRDEDHLNVRVQRVRPFGDVGREGEPDDEDPDQQQR